MRRRLSVATFSLAAVLFSTVIPPAAAHEETALHALSVLHDVDPEIAGVSFRVVQLTQAVLVATNSTDRPLVVEGPKGEPFLRIVHGRVEMNLRSPLAYTSADPTGRSVAPAGLDVFGKPRWELEARSRTWSWFDPRIRFAPARNDWTIRARLGRRAIAISGGFEALDGHGHFTTELLDTPDIPDLEIRLLQGAVPGLFVRNDTGRTLTVPGRRGEPFLRIGPRGVVSNARSPAYYLGGTNTIRAVPPSADPQAAPRWQRLSEIPIWAWLEFRARLPARLEQRSVLGPERRTVLSWTTPMSLDGEPLELTGRVVWIPPQSNSRPGSDDVIPLTLGGIVVIAGLGFVVWLRRHA